MTGKEKTELRKTQILQAAAKVFAEKGFQEGTIPDVAKESGVSEASIYEYFSNKENLLFSIPMEAMQRLSEKIDFHLKLIRGSAEKLRAILYLQLLFYIENRDYAAVIMLILKQNRRFLDTEAHQAIRKHLKTVDKVIRDGMECGEFRNDMDPYLIRSTCLGSMEHVVTNWLMLGHPTDEELLKWVDPMLNALVRGVGAGNELNQCPLKHLIVPEDVEA
ncbi:transcriptional regulator, TetR family [Desulfatibacillum alkenivorans DSM 16219]|uniref:Transcriptional regulator, TetR family n=1 Tax=Desulfatibacillum alkenivorans DSM 16219 TaxID=1121393 RepID=A0A1M6TF77_9BACT|nr:TetR/AcrR family transcriptional regulator [Desulfatibacillum alkenivorans]SHK55539.1 transcriptional regulator, TetR family [Desulfatibacillum alkenivorans DSM 16219]